MCGGLGMSPKDLPQIRQCLALQPSPKVKITQVCGKSLAGGTDIKCLMTS